MQQIIISGVGGQGILFVTRVLAEAALDMGFSILISETHGMAQRGGNVVSHLKVSARPSAPDAGSPPPFASPLIRPGRADILLALHPEGEAAHGHYLRAGGTLIANRPEPSDFLSVDAAGIALNLGSPVSANLVLLGFAAKSGARLRNLRIIVLHISAMIWQILPQFLVAGITNGSIYALIGLGFCLIQNATGLVNFAQGDFVMLGAMVAISLMQAAGLPMIVAFPASIVVVALVAIALEQGPLRLSRNRDILTLVMITVGASMSFRGSSMMIWGKNAHIFPALGGETPIVFWNAAILPQTLWILAISLVVLSLLYLFFHCTLLGKAVRAAADNPQGALLIGISVRKVVALAFALAGGLGALAGILVTPITSMSFDGGLMLGLKGFAAAILGGYGSTLGAVAGGLLLGILESLGAGFISSAYKDAFAFLILLTILFVKPAGLFGSVRVKRV